MAVTIQTVQNNSRNLVLNVYIALANTDAVIFDAGASDDNLSLVEAQWSLTGAPATLEWDATTDDVLVDLNAGHGFFMFDPGIHNPRSSGYTNDITLTNAAGLTSGTVYLKFKKN